MALTTAAPARQLSLTHGALYDIETTAGVIWRRLQWHAENYAFMLNDRGGIPIGYVQSVTVSGRRDWHPLGELHVVSSSSK